MKASTAKTSTAWQVQIYVSDVDEWYGWSECELQPTKKLAEHYAMIASKQYGWESRIVKVKL